MLNFEIPNIGAKNLIKKLPHIESFLMNYTGCQEKVNLTIKQPMNSFA